MTFRALFVLSLSVLLIIPNVSAQEDGQRPRRDRDRDRDRDRSGERPDGQRPGGFRGPGAGMMGGLGAMMGGMQGGGGASQLIGLLRMEEVRKEVGITDEVYEAVQERQQTTFSQMRELREASEERRKEILDGINTSSQELLDEVLPPAKQQRLLGLFVQMVGAPAVLNPLVAKELGLSKDTSEEIQKEMEAFGTKMRERFAEMREGGGGVPDFAKIQDEITKIRDELNSTVEAKLTEDQKKQLESLKGEKFDFPEMGMMQGGFGQGGFGGRGDRPQRGDRPGGNRQRNSGNRD